MGTTIEQIAKLCGVSVATVSRALNRPEDVSNETREKIRHVASELGYVPNAAARSLTKGRSRLIGLTVPDFKNPTFVDIARGAQAQADALGLTVAVFDCAGSPQREKSFFDVSVGFRFGGMLVIPLGDDDNEVDMLNRAGMSVVLIGRDTLSSSAVVKADNVSGAYQAVTHLVKLNHRKIAFIAGPSGLSTSDERIEGYRLAIAEHGIRFEEELIRTADFSIEGGYAAAQQLLHEVGREGFTALAGANDLIALGAIRQFEENGIAVPNDVSVVGFDDIQWLSHLKPALTTVKVPTYDMGVTALNLLWNALSGQAAGQLSKAMLPTTLVHRASTAPCATVKYNAQ